MSPIETTTGPFGTDGLGPDSGAAPLDFPPSLYRDWLCRNGLAVGTELTGRAIETLRHIYKVRRKLVFHKTANLSNAGSGGPSYMSGDRATSGATVWWSFHCHTGYGASELVFHHLLQGPDGTVATSHPRVRWRVYDSTGTAIEYTDYAYAPRGPLFGFVDTGRARNNVIRYPCDENTTYIFELEASDYVRPLTVSAWEERAAILPFNADAVAQQTTTYKGGVYADDYWDIVAKAERLRSRNGAAIFCYSRRTNAASAKTFLSTTYTSIIDSAAPFVGYRIDLSGADTISGRGVPCRLAVLARASSGTASPLLGVKLTDSTGAVTQAELTGWTSTTAEWKTAEFNLTDLTGPLLVRAKGSGSVSLVLDAVCLYQYDSAEPYLNPPQEGSLSVVQSGPFLDASDAAVVAKSMAVDENFEFLNFDRAEIGSVQISYDASLVADFYVDFSNNEDAVLTEAVGTNWVDSGITITSAASGAAAQLITFDNIGCRKARLRVDRSTTGALTARYHLQG